MEKNKLTDRIELYESFIKDKKIGESSVPYYQKQIDNAKKYLSLIGEGKMTPEEFAKLNDSDKWDVASILKDIIWCCDECKHQQGEELPVAPFFDGDSLHCSNCDSMLTQRTRGGQNNPFNYTFVKNK